MNVKFIEKRRWWKSIEKRLLVWINFERMEWWWYAKMQFVFSKPNYRSTNKHIRLFLCSVQRMWCTPLVACITQCVCSLIQRRGNLSSSFSESNKFLWRKFLCLFVKRTKAKTYCKERERKEIDEIVGEWSRREKKEVVYDRGRNMTDINAICTTCILGLHLVEWQSLKCALLHGWKCCLKCSKHITTVFTPNTAAASFTSLSNGSWKIQLECDYLQM